jgi:hypothetical protein
MPTFSFLKKIIGRFSARGILSFWYRYYKVLFFLGFFIVLLIGGWNWYYSFYLYRLSDEEKKQYVEQYFKETTFKETKFRQVVDALSERARLHAETLKLNRNIFEGKGIVPKN